MGRHLELAALVLALGCAAERPSSDDAASGILPSGAAAEDGIDPESGDDSEVLDVAADDGQQDDARQ